LRSNQNAWIFSYLFLSAEISVTFFAFFRKIHSLNLTNKTITMKVLKPLFIFFFFTAAVFTDGATIVDGINQKSYDNALKTYNFTCWDSSFKTNVTTRKFSDQTSSYNLSVNYSTLNINSLSVNSLPTLPSAAFSESVTTTFSTTQPGNIDYKILQNGTPLYEKPTTTVPTNLGPNIGQLAEYGTWCNRRVVDSLNFTNSPSVYGSFTGIEFTNWHNRFKITFHLKPRADITNGQLQLSVQLPTVYATLYNKGNIYGFAKSATGEGFAVKGGATASSTYVTGNTVFVKTTSMTLLANSSYQVSLIFYPVKNSFSTVYATTPDDLEETAVSATQTLPDKITKVPVAYNNDEGMYIIDVPVYKMGYQDCSYEDVLQNIKLQIVNSQLKDKRVRLCFRQISSLNVVGFSSMLRNPNGDPSGIPLQISKDWHDKVSMLYSDNWIKEYTEIIVPASTTLNFDYTRAGAKWGTVYGAFSHQLSVVGSDVSRGGWLQAGLGGFGENITHSPDYEFGNANICDYRPFLTTNAAYGGTSSACSWTGNVGGMDLWIYKNSSNTRIYQSQVKTRFKKYGPNLTETSVSAYSSDNKLKLDYTFYLNRSDDYTRVFYKIKIKALQATTFSRFDIFQLGSDIYRYFKPQSIAYGDSSGVVKQFLPTNIATNDYTTPATALTGNTPWIWAGDGMYTGLYGTDAISTNNGLIIKSYTASFGGKANNTPYFRERVSTKAATLDTPVQYPTSYCLVPPPTVTSFAIGDSVEVLLETCILPKQVVDYYGSNSNFIDALARYGNTWQLLYREAKGNTTIAGSTKNVINNSYPLTVKTINNTADVTIQRGIGYVPVVFRGLTSITTPKLWWLNKNVWVLIDQSNKGNDFWQADFDQETGLFDLIFNVNQDIVNNGTANIRYYLGSTPPVLTSLTQTKSESLDIKIYPNPTKGRCSITSENESIESVRIFNLLGMELTKQIQPIGLNTTRVTLDLSSFAPNRYILKVNNYNSVIVVE
jgi:Secretion system C-terminal sorting domain